MKNLSLIVCLFSMLVSGLANGQTVTATYSAGDIPTNNGSYSSSCNGPLTTLTVNLPAGTSWEVTSIDVVYDMTAAGGAWKSEQRSQIYCQNTTTDEGGYNNGSGGSSGTYSYSRSGLTIANGTYAGSTALVFEMRAFRSWCSSCGCNTSENKVNNSTWQITVHYQAPVTCPAPSALGSANETGTTADLSWTENGAATQWDLEVGTQGFTATGTPTHSGVTANPYSITGLTPSSSYDFYVRADCGGGDLSTWAGPHTFSTTVLTGQVYLTASAGSTTGTYSTVKGAFDKINDGTHQGDITLVLGASPGETITETAEAVLNKSGSGSASYTSVTLQPGAASVKITGAISGSCCTPSGVLRLNQAENVVIDGRVGGTGTTSALTIENTTVGSYSSSVVFFGASNNVLKYCTVKSAVTGSCCGAGTVSITDTNSGGGTGSSNNLVEHCTITKSGSNLPRRAVYGKGASTRENNSNTIRNCTIFDFSEFGIYLGNNSSDGYNRSWTIDSNTVYQSSAFATMSYDQVGICIGQKFSTTGTENGTFTVRANTVGGNGAGGDWDCTSNSSQRVAGISLNTSTTGYTTVTSNYISNFDVATTSTATDYGMFSGIVVSNGKVNIGGEGGNRIGNFTESDNIVVARNNASTGGFVSGIQVRSSTDLENIINNNAIGGISMTTGSGNLGTFYGIRNNSSTTYPADSVYRNNISYCEMTKVNYCYGIFGQGLIAKNRVRDLDFTGASSFSELTGIRWNGGDITGSGARGVENNEVMLGLDKSGTSIGADDYIIGIDITRGDAEVYYNSVLIQGASTGSDNTVAIEIPNSGHTLFNDNLMYNERTGGTGKHYSISSTHTNSSLWTSTHNAYITGAAANNYLGYWGADVSTLAAWQTSSAETNSIADDNTGQPTGTLFPQVAQDSLDVANPSWLTAGTPLTDPGNDIALRTRDATTPTIGAYEKNIALPVELLSFTATCIDGVPILEWETASEINNSHFVVEQAVNLAEFEPIGIVDGAGTTGHVSSYQFAHESRLIDAEATRYYRLRQVDFDGAERASYTVAVNSCGDEPQSGINVWPVPSATTLNVAISAEQTPVDYRIIAADGSTKQSGTLKSEQSNIDISKLSPGMYMLRLDNGAAHIVLKH